MTNVEWRDYYDNPDVWDPLIWKNHREDLERIQIAVDWLPQETSSLLDVGCGNGAFINLQHAHMFTVGLDSSIVPLRYVTAPHLQASAGGLPFTSGSFDACLCMEILEHLPIVIYQKALDEIARTARHHILITVPFNENLSYGRVVCPACLCRFHPYHHVRQYNKSSFPQLFKEKFILVKLEPIVFKKQKAVPFLWNLVRSYKHRNGLNFPKQVVCPQCGYSVDNKSLLKKVKNIQYRQLSLQRYWPEVTSYRWWMALYQCMD